ncbi:hypothetical protein QBC37DRAFT_411460 [Rhypophila decipiens]|uniref:Pentatricopeptide repeat domain-containing protein n=1 Tax=Rhypophila decipiens TaxID=261697 RepID=A0AAN6YM54_9PEZI|nr:hypothetical protein QBC37DRAFT_411460 [Rhypophila decipiens]
MPPRAPFSLDLSRTSYVCQSCVASLIGPSPQLWLTRSASTVSRRGARPLGRPPVRGPRPSRGTRTVRPSPAAAPRPSTRAGNADFQTELLETLAASTQKDAIPTTLTEVDSTATDTDPDIRFFDADENGQIQQLRDSKEFGKISGGLDAEIEKTINNLEAQMENTIELLNRMEEEGDPDKAEELRKQFKKTLRDQYKGRLGLEAEDYKALRIRGFSSRQKNIAALNKFLARESLVIGGEPKRKDLQECWKAYSLARKTLSSSWDCVPKEVWDFLWTVISWKGPDNPNRMSHIYQFTKDMTAAGIPLRASQQLLAIEAMFIEGWEDEAIDAWKKAVVTLGAKPESFVGYWELGARMLCIRGDSDRAHRAVDTLLDSEHEVDPRILLPLIRAYSKNDATQPLAWQSYQRLRELLNSEMQIEDYDDIIASFLAEGCVEDALQVFVDMMFSNVINIRGKSTLPLSVGNHFFIGKWLKRLIGAGDLDGAYKVVAFLREKGVVPSPIQLNGLIGAWLRSGTTENLDKAERVAWDMIRSRITYVQLRRRGQLLHGPNFKFYDPVKDADLHVADGAIKMGTRASLETFAILAENYSTRRLHGKVEQLLQFLKESELGTTSFIMNQVIKSYTRDNNAARAVEVYHEMTGKGNVRPDSHTFLTLFDSLAVNRVITIDEYVMDEDLPLARQFFRDMVDAEWKFESLDTYHFMPRHILFSMLKTKDYTGMIVAARAMRALFDFIPQEALLVELCTGTPKLRVMTDANLEIIMEGTRTVAGLIDRYRKQMTWSGVDMSSPTTDQRAEELSVVLERLVMVKADAKDADPRDVEPLLEEAAREMGVYDIIFERDEERVERKRKIFGHHVYRAEEESK